MEHTGPDQRGHRAGQEPQRTQLVLGLAAARAVCDAVAGRLLREAAAALSRHRAAARTAADNAEKLGTGAGAGGSRVMSAAMSSRPAPSLSMYSGFRAEMFLALAVSRPPISSEVKPG